MKKTNCLRVLCTCLAISVFACMAMASGSDTKKESATVKIKTGGEVVSEDTVAVVTEEEIKYEVTNTYFTHYTNSINREMYSGIVEITNTGNSYLYLGSCKFDLEDDNGHLLQSDGMILNTPDVIGPGEKGYYFETHSIDEGVSLDNGINLVPTYTIEIAKEGAASIVDYQVSDLDIRDEKYGGMKVTGRITNNTSTETSSVNVKVYALFFDKEGNIIEIGFTYPDALAPGDTTSFEISTMLGNRDIQASDVADYKVYARKTTYNF